MFYSKAIRVLAIIQLCLVFSLLAWHMSYPFMGQLFASKSKKQLILTVLGQDLAADKAKMERNQLRFRTLPINQQISIQRYLDDINYKLKQSFGKKIVRAIHILAFEISPTEQMWIVFSIVIPLLFLMNFDTAKQVAYLLPLITLCYCLDNRWNGYRELSKEARLFPTEEMITKEYLDKPLSSTFALQQSELTLGWQRYLIQQWANEIPSENQQEWKRQMEMGEYRFQVARVLAQASQPPQLELYTFKRQQAVPVLLLYMIWNLFFAWIANRPPSKIGYFHNFVPMAFRNETKKSRRL